LSFRRVCAAVALAFAVLALGPVPAGAVSSELFFSEYIEGSSNNKALEIFNDTGSTVNLLTAGYDVQMCFNGNPCSLVIPLTGSVADDDVYVLAHSSATNATIVSQADQTNGAGWFNGNDAVLLRKNGVVIDSIGQREANPGTEWGTGLTSTADNTLRRKSTVLAGDTIATDAFDPAVEWDGFAIDTTAGLGGHATGEEQPVIVSCGGPLALLEGTSGSRTVTATDADDRVVDIAITSITPAPAAGSITRTSLTPSPVDGAQASATIEASDALPPGSYSAAITATNDDAATQTGSCNLTVNVTEIKSIGEIQGPVLDTDNPLTHRSPLIPTGGPNPVVFTQGVVTQKLMNRSSAGVTQHAIFLQSTESTDDDNPLSSDGIYVFMNRFPDLLRDDGVAGNYVPQVGHEIVVRATVSEFFNMTQLSSARLQRVVSTMVTAPEPLELNLPDDLAAANRLWERHEGEQAKVVKQSIALDGLDHFAGSEDGEVWLARPDTTIAQRTSAYERRAFRDAHPLDDIAATVFDNGNGYRMMIGSHGVKATLNDPMALVTPSRTFDTLQNDLVGGIYFGFSKYQVMPAQQPVFEHGADPSLNAPPQAFDRGAEYSIADYNVENLYDLRDDPHDGCDFVGNAGCPGVSPPFNYVPADQATYEAHLGDLAAQIHGDLHSPDILLIQEAEDQDICTVAGTALSCGTANNADGKADTLQELALTIRALGGPAYDVAYDRNGADDRGIVSAFMYRTDRVELLPASPTHPVLGATPAVEYRSAGLAYNTDVQNPKALNAVLPTDVDKSTGVDGVNVFTRPPEVGLFRVWRTGKAQSVFTDVLAISNHFSSTPDGRVGQRTEQSNYLAAIVEAAPEQRIDAGGDFNTFPRPDDPLNRPTTPHQLAALYDAAGMTNLFDRLVAEVPASAYSYVFVGMAQTLDGQFVSPKLANELGQARIAHINADWPADTAGDGARGASDHDPMVARFDGDVSVERLRALVLYFDANGEITGRHTTRNLLLLLDLAQRAQDRGKVRTYRALVRAFAHSAYEKKPKRLSARASAALMSEANRLVPPPPHRGDDDSEDDEDDD
jgi:predicted extracellular nuclease